jgi:hypothetical protein
MEISAIGLLRLDTVALFIGMDGDALSIGPRS